MLLIDTVREGGTEDVVSPDIVIAVVYGGPPAIRGIVVKVITISVFEL